MFLMYYRSDIINSFLKNDIKEIAEFYHRFFSELFFEDLNDVLVDYLNDTNNVCIGDITVNDEICEDKLAAISLNTVKNIGENKFEVNFSIFSKVYENCKPIIVCTLIVSNLNIMNLKYFAFKYFAYSYAKKYMSYDNLNYHTINHVNKMLNHLHNDINDSLPHNTLSGQHMLYLAICFHDAVYIPGNKNNEEESAEVFKRECTLLSKDKVDLITDLILSTKIGYDYNKLMKIQYADILHDLDYISFSSIGEIINNNKKIEHECSNLYTPNEFMKGQIDFYKSLLNLPHTFYFSDYYKHLSDRAIKNINIILRISKLHLDEYTKNK